MIDLVLRMLQAMSKPPDDMLSVIAEYLTNVCEPCTSLYGITKLDRGRSIEIEALDAFVLYPAAVRNKPVLDNDRLAGRPRHLFHGPILIEPYVGPDCFGLTIVLENGLSVRVEQRHWRDT